MTHDWSTDLRAIANEIVAPSAGSVDRDGVFPAAAFERLAERGLLGASVPVEDGGLGWDLGRIALATEILASRCLSTGMVWAMHHSQVLTVVHAGRDDPTWREIGRSIVERGVLVASVASEPRRGGALGTSDAAFEHAGDEVVVRKGASTVSYGLAAGAYFVSARRAQDAKPEDTQLAFVWREQCELTDVGEWRALGMRGTDSRPMTLSARFPPSQLLREPFSTLLVRWMVPDAHILWSAAWIAATSAAVDVARRAVRGRRTAPAQAESLRAATANVALARALLDSAMRRPRLDASVSGAMPMLRSVGPFNELKIQVSELCRAATVSALDVVGIGGYLLDSPTSIERTVRDVLSAPLMVANYRLKEAQATMALDQAREP